MSLPFSSMSLRTTVPSAGAPVQLVTPVKVKVGVVFAAKFAVRPV